MDWAKTFVELVNRLVGAAGKTKPTPICPYLFHLYESKGLLTEDEETNYRATEELTQYRITPDRDPESDSEVLRITEPEPPRVATHVNQVKRENMLKQTYWALEGSPLVRSKGEGSQPHSSSHQSEGVRPNNPRPSSPRPRSPPPERPQPELRPDPQQPKQPEQEEKPWIQKPFDSVIKSYKVVKA